MPPPAKTNHYVSNGQVLSGSPLGVRFRGFIESSIIFLGLYITTLFSFDPFAAGRASAYNINNRVKDGSRTGKGFFSGGAGVGKGGGGGGGGPGPGSDGSGIRLGRVDDIRGAECNSCSGAEHVIPY